MRAIDLRNPARLTEWLIEDNGAGPIWSAWFEVQAGASVDAARMAFESAGAFRATPLAGQRVLVEFDAARVRRIAAAAAAHRAIPIGRPSGRQPPE